MTYARFVALVTVGVLGTACDAPSSTSDAAMQPGLDLAQPAPDLAVGGDLAGADLTPPPDMTAPPAASLQISDGATYDFGTRALGSSTEHVFTVTNGGGVQATAIAASALSAPFGFTGGAYPGTSGTCGATLGAGASCTVAITFSPTATASADATLALAYHDGATTQSATRALQGAGTNRAFLAISDATTYAFGAVTIGASAQHAFVVSNTGMLPATAMSGGALAAPYGYLGNAYPGTGGTCAATLAAGDTCTVVVRFSPTVKPTANATLSLGYHDGAATQAATRAMSGTGRDAAVLTISDGPTYQFGTLALNDTIDHTFTLSNGGEVPATGLAASGVSGAFSYLGLAYPGSGGTCTSSLGAGLSCTIVLRFSPTQAQAYGATLTVDYNDGVTSRQATRGLAGAGTNLAFLQITDFPAAYYSQFGLPPDGASFDFGASAIGSASTHTFYVTNTGAATATALAGPALSPAVFSYLGGGVAPGQGGTCGATLAAGASCTIVVSFVPTMAVSSMSTVTLSYHDGNATQSATRPLAGSGTNEAVLVITDFDLLSIGPSWDYGTIGVGSTAEHTFYVKNNGAAAATAMSGMLLGIDFRYKGGAYPGTGGSCGTMLVAGASCVVIVEFHPTAAGPLADTIQINYTAASAQTALRPVKGVGTQGAIVTIEQQGIPGLPSVDFGTRGIGSDTDKQLVVRNQGAQQASLSGASTDLPFSVESSTCSATLAAGASCTLVARFHPTSSVSSSATLVMGYSDAGGARTATISLLGEGTSRALVRVADHDDGFQSPDAYDFGTAGAATGHQFHVFNDGAVPATALAFGGLAAPFTVGQTTCGATLSPGASCTVNVIFSPSADAQYGDTLEASYHDGVQAQLASRTVKGAGTTRALLTIEDCSQGCAGGTTPSYVFHTIGIGLTDTHRFYVQNVGFQATTSLTPSLAAGPFAIAGTSCGAALAPGASCYLDVSFSPASASPVNATLLISYTDGVGARPAATRPLSGTGTTHALLYIDDNDGNGGGSDSVSPYDFGLVGTSTLRSFFVRNIGGQGASNLSVVAPQSPFSLESSSCGSTLAVGGSCMVFIRLTPSSNGPVSGAFSVQFADATGNVPQPSVSRALAGTATTRALLYIADFSGSQQQSGPDPYDFGTHGTPTSHDFMVYNAGFQSAQVVVDPMLGPFEVVETSCTNTLFPGAYCGVSVRFSPVGDGLASGTLELRYSDADGARPSVTRAITGTSSTRALLKISPCAGCDPLGPAPYDFGTRGTPSVHTFYVSNSGVQAATSLTIGAPLPPFALAGTDCTAPLGPNGRCSVTIVFSPSGDGPGSSQATISFGDATGALPSLALGLSGTSTSHAYLVVDDGPGFPSGGPGNQPAFDFGTWGIPASHTFTVRNDGAVEATGVSFLGLAAPLTVTGDTCGGTVAVGGSCTVTVGFQPAGNATTGRTLTIPYSDGTGAQTPRTRQLLATSTTSALLLVRGANQPPEAGRTSPYGTEFFGVFGVPTTKTLYVFNVGGASASAMSGSANLGDGFTLAGGFPGTGGTCTGTLASGGAPCTVVVTYTPDGTNKTHGANLFFTYAGGGSSTSAERYLTAVSTTHAQLTIIESSGPSCGDSCGPYDFGLVASGSSSSPRQFTLTNTGASAATTLSFLPLALGFGVSNQTCAAPLGVNQSCTFDVTFTPPSPGLYVSNIQVDYGDGGDLMSAYRGLTGGGQ